MGDVRADDCCDGDLLARVVLEPDAFVRLRRMDGRDESRDRELARPLGDELVIDLVGDALQGSAQVPARILRVSFSDSTALC